jgi:hypothetical protein
VFTAAIAADAMAAALLRDKVPSRLNRPLLLPTPAAQPLLCLLFLLLLALLESDPAPPDPEPP